MVEYNAELMSDKDLLEAANIVFSAQEKDFEKIKTEKWYQTFFHAITLNQDEKKYAVRGIRSLAKLQQLFMNIYVKNYRKSHEQLDAVIEAVTKNSAAIKNLYATCVLNIEEQSALEQLDNFDGEILALFLGEYRDENGNVPSKVREYNRGVLLALNQKVPSGSLENHQISKLKAPKIVYRCFMEQCAVDGTIDTQEWPDKIYQNIDDFELGNNTKLEIKESVKREVEIAGVDYLLVKYTKNNSGVLDTDFVIELADNEPITNHTVDDYDINNAEQKLLNGKLTEALEMFTKLANFGDARAMYHLGELYSFGYNVIPVNKETARQWRKKGAELGDILAKLNTAYVYDKGSAERIGIINEVIDDVHAMANAGDVFAQNELADLYMNGEGVDKNEQLQLEWLEKSANGGYFRAIEKLGDFYFYKNDVDTAINWYKKGAERGDAASYHDLGEIYRGTKSLYKMAFDYYVKASELGDIYAAAKVGYFYDGYWGKGVIPVNYDEAFKWYSIGAERGDSKALLFLGQMYEYGNGTQKNLETAMACYEKAYEEGNSDAASWIGGIYKENNNLDEAIKWYEISYETGDVFAPYALGGLYEKKNNLDEAIKWYKIGAEHDNYHSQGRLGDLFEKGKGVNKDLSLAFDYYLKAAKQGNKWSEYDVGRFYYYGLAGEKDLNKAKEWLTASASQGVEKATELLQQIE